jgi:hypothetical protein
MNPDGMINFYTLSILVNFNGEIVYDTIVTPKLYECVFLSLTLYIFTPNP